MENLIQYCKRHNVSIVKVDKYNSKIVDYEGFKKAMTTDRFPLKKGQPSMQQMLGPHYKHTVTLPTFDGRPGGRNVYL